MVRPPIRERAQPRISANDLALYMVSSDTARMGIARRAKHPQIPPIIRYRDVRAPICSYLADPTRAVNPLVTAEEMFRQRLDDPAMSALQRDDAEHSIDVLHAIQHMRNAVAGYDFGRAPERQGRLIISGVEVSVKADLLVYGAARGIEQIGAAVLRMTMDDADTDAAREKRRDMGLYVATLARMHVDQNLPSTRTPVNRLCLSIDIQHGEVFAAPNANARRASDIQNVCQVIAALWPDL